MGRPPSHIKSGRGGTGADTTGPSGGRCGAAAAGDAGAKIVMVGAHRRLGPVDPGGGFEALVARYGAAVPR